MANWTGAANASFDIVIDVPDDDGKWE